MKSKFGKFIDEVLDLLKSIVIAFAIIVLTFTFFCRTARVNGESMENTLLHGDFLVLYNFFYTPEAGDIISANCEGLNEVIIKRIIATEGQTVDIDFSTGKVYVDGEVIDEPYIKNLTINDEHGHKFPVTVPEGKYFVMGDNRQGSLDSRSGVVGFVDREDILGKAILRLFPFNRLTILK